MRLYINNLAYVTTEQALTDAFAAHGTVSNCRIPLNPGSKIRQGFGYVFMPDADEADKAIKALNGSALDGKKIEVRESRKKKRTANVPPPGTAGSLLGNQPRSNVKVNRMGIPRIRKTQDK